MEKKCSKCGLVKSLDDFNNVNRKDGSIKKYSWCKECKYQYNKNWVQNNKELKRKHRARYRHNKKNIPKIKEWFLNNKEKLAEWHHLRPAYKRAYSCISRRAKEGKFSCCSIDEFKIWYENQEKICIYCGSLEKDFLNMTSVKLPNTSRFDIDRKDNSGGYTLDNMCLACRDCNTVKNCILTYEDMKFIGKNFIKPKHDEKLGLNLC